MSSQAAAVLPAEGGYPCTQDWHALLICLCSLYNVVNMHWFTSWGCSHRELFLASSRCPSHNTSLRHHLQPMRIPVADASHVTLHVQVQNLTIRAKGKVLLENTQCAITAGRRYGLVGPNGKGKSTLLRLLARRQIPVPEGLDVLLVEQVISKTTFPVKHVPKYCENKRTWKGCKKKICTGACEKPV